MYTIYEEMFPVYFSRFFSTDEEIDFIETLKANSDVFVFSSVLGDFLLQYVLHCKSETPRDFDFVVGEINERIRKFLMKYLIRQNQFGGYKCKINNKEIDIWEVRNTWAIKKYRPFFLQDYLPLTSFFNITAAVFWLNKNKLFIHDSFKEFIEKKDSRKLDIVLEDNPNPALCIIKTLYLMDRYQLPLSDKLDRYLKNNIRNLSEQDFINVQYKHYGTIKYNYPTVLNRVDNSKVNKNKEANNTKTERKPQYINNDILLFEWPEICINPL